MAAASAAFPLLTGRFVQALTDGNENTAQSIVIVFGVVGVVNVVLWALLDYCDGLLVEKIGLAVRNRIVQHLYSVPVSFFSSRQRGEIENMINADVVTLVSKTHAVVVPIAAAALNSGFVLVSMFFIDWRLAIASITLIPLWFGVQAYNRGRAKTAQARALSNRDRLSTRIIEFLSPAGMFRSAVFHQREADSTKFQSIVSESVFCGLRLKAIYRAQYTIILVGSVIVGAAVLLFGAYLYVHSLTTIGHIVSFIGFQASLQRPISVLSGTQLELQSIKSISSRVDTVLAANEESVSGIDGELGDGIEVRGLRVAYGSRTVLDNISLHVAPMSRTAIVGPSGSGKTTLALALQRLVDGADGLISIGDRNLNELSVASIRAVFSFAGPNDHFFSGSLEQNLRYANPEATPTQIGDTLTRAGCSEFVYVMRDGIKTKVGPAEDGFSSGQLQRLYLARALLKRSQVLVLDEATSAIDIEAERRLFQSLRNEERALVIITHRLASILWVDNIIVLDSGHVSESGAPAELLARRGMFWRLLSLQTGSDYQYETSAS